MRLAGVYVHKTDEKSRFVAFQGGLQFGQDSWVVAV